MSKKPQAPKPVIGINGEFRAPRKDTVPLSWFSTGSYDKVTAAGGLPLLVPPLADDDDLKQWLSMVDGVVLTGCPLDLDPIRLGMDPHPATRPMPPRREDFDRRLAKAAYARRLPILAIGAGMQTLNAVCGGTLIQNIAEERPKALHHRDPVESSLRHIIEIVPGTRMDAIYGPGEIRVNSQHHMAVDQPAPPFKVSAICPDGIVEAYESVDDDWFCLGVQFHPENGTSSALDMQVFETFLDACKQHVDEQPQILPFTRAAA